jgi:hypothetical protein
MRALLDRLDADLLDARRRGRSAEVAAIRSLKSSLADAEAVQVQDGPYRVVQGSTDVPRRRLLGDDVTAIVAAEIAEREDARRHYRATGVPTHELELELATLVRYRRPR